MVLSDQQVELVNRLQKGQFGDVNFDEYQVRRSCDSRAQLSVSPGPDPPPPPSLTLATPPALPPAPGGDVQQRGDAPPGH